MGWQYSENKTFHEDNTLTVAPVTKGRKGCSIVGAIIGEWEKWGRCQKDGKKYRSASYTNDEKYGCEGTTTQYEMCGTEGCSTVGAIFGEWGKWGYCQKDGKRYRIASYINKEESVCGGTTTQYKMCECKKGVIWYGGKIGQDYPGKNVTTMQACSKLCLQYHDCNVWTYYKDRHDCYLYTAGLLPGEEAGEYEYETTASGARGCHFPLDRGPCKLELNSRVSRGRTWRRGRNEDGGDGQLGVVYEIIPHSGEVKVIWDQTPKTTFWYRLNDKFEDVQVMC